MKMAFCLRAIKMLGDQDLSSLTDKVEAYTQAGMDTKAAEMAAVDDMLAEVRQDRDELHSAIREQHPGMFAQAPKAEKVEATPATQPNEGPATASPEAESQAPAPKAGDGGVAPTQGGGGASPKPTAKTRTDDAGNGAMFSRAPATDSKEFRNWFGDSKVVGEDGKPLVVYHGTNGDFNTFDDERFGATDGGGLGRGFYFSERPTARDTLEKNWKMAADTYGNAIYPVYLNIKNPATAGQAWALKRDGLTSTEVRDKLIAQGNDGVVLTSAGVTTYVAFRPEQIKSATGNLGAFDPTNADIRYQRAAQTGRTEAMTVPKVQGIVANIKAGWRNAPNVVVVDSLSGPEVPERVRQAEQAAVLGGAGVGRGVILGETIYLAAGALHTEAMVSETLFHEALGHYGLRGMFGGELDTILGQLSAALPEKVTAKAIEYRLNPLERADRLIAAEEVLAELAQTRPTSTWVQRAIAAIRTWLRANVPGFADLALPEPEVIRNFIIPARAFVERGRLAAMRDMPAFSRATNDAVPADTNAPGPQGGERTGANQGNAVTESNMPPERAGFTRLYHAGSDPITGGYFQTVPSGGVFDGMFALTSRFGNYGTGAKYFADIADGKILTQHDIDYEISHKDTIAALRKAMPWLADADVDFAYEAVIEDKHNRLDEGDLTRIFREDSFGEASWEAQRVRGLVAKELGYQAVQMSDENGTSTLLVAGTPLTRVIPNEQSAPDSGGAMFARAARDQTSTPEFKRWFGGSPVVDADGKPLVMYHGTNGDFNAFDPEKIGGNFGVDEEGFFFTSSKIGASRYADPASELLAAGINDPTKQEPRTGANVIPVYLSVQNPLTLAAYNSAFYTNTAVEIDEQGISLTDYFDDNRRSIMDFAKKGGYDGVVFQHKGKMLAVAFRPEQIKSATGNSGAFDPADADIRFSRAPRHDAAESLGLPPGAAPLGSDDAGQARIESGYVERAKRYIGRMDHVINGLGRFHMGDKFTQEGVKQGFLKRIAQTEFAVLPDSEQFMVQRYETLGKIAKIDEVAGMIRKVFGNATAEDKKAIYNYLTTKGANTSGIGASVVADAAQAVKTYIGDVGDQLTERGLISAESRELYRDKYLPRMYLAHLLDDADWRAIGTGKKVSDQGYLKARKDIPQEIRDVILGEVKDPTYLAASALAKPMRDMALLDWLEQISQNEKWIFPASLAEWQGKKVSVYWLKSEADALRNRARLYPEPANKDKANAIAEQMDTLASLTLGDANRDHYDYKRMPDAPRYGRLRGMLVRTEIYNDIMGSGVFESGDKGWVESVLGYGGIGTKATQLWKASKVSMNIPGQVRNVISNGVSLQLSGVPLHRFPEYIGRFILQYRHGGKHWEVAKKYGVTESTFQAHELFRSKRDLIYLEKSVRGMTPMLALKSVGAAIMDTASDAYQFSEAMFKTIKIMDAMGREGMDEASAALEAQKWLFDYSMLDKNLRYARNAPVGAPFITYSTKILPRLVEVAALHPQRFLPWVGLYYGMQMAASIALGSDDEDWWKKAKKPLPLVGDSEWAGLKKALPEWMRDKAGIVFLPFRDSAGRLQALDMSYYFPWSMWVDFATNVMGLQVTDAIKNLGIFSGPLPSIMAAISTGKDAFTGRDILNKADPPADKAAALVAYAWDMAMPPMMGSHGVVSPLWLLDPQYGGKVAQAVRGTTNKQGDQRSTMGQAAARLIGANVYGIDPWGTREINIARLKVGIKETESRMKALEKDLGLTKDERQALRERYRNEKQKRKLELDDYALKSMVPKFAERKQAPVTQ